MRVTVAFPTNPEWKPVAKALCQGFTCIDDDVVSVAEHGISDELFEWTQLLCLLGHDDNQPIHSRFSRAAKHVLLVDKGYLLPKTYYRFALDGWQSRWMSATNYESDRLGMMLRLGNIYLKPRRNEDKQTITYFGMTGMFAKWHRLGNPLEFDFNQAWGVSASLPSSITKILIKASYNVNRREWLPKYAVDAAGLSFKDCLDQSSCLVTWGQPEAVYALTQGIPVIDLARPEVSPLYPSVNRTPESINHICWPRDLIASLSRLAHNEFSLKEIISGKALEGICGHTAKQFETYEDSETLLIAQYRFMHENPKMFRGRLADVFVNEITKLTTKHNAETLLDYGSGKGRQYYELAQHKKWGIKPTCYDPGYLPYATKPKGKFDGVICTDVAEHVPTESVHEFLTEVIGYARKFAFFVIFTDAAVKNLPDGRNVHLTVKPPNWWNEQISKVMQSGSERHNTLKVEQISPDTYVLATHWFETVVFYRNSQMGKETE